jgi:hypothetical protein
MQSWIRRALPLIAVALVVAGVCGADRHDDSALVSNTTLHETTLQLPGITPGTKVVAAALADIDADGDLDVIASDGSLDLLVWSNDGSGHFTRKYPVDAPHSESALRDGAFDPDAGTPPASVIPGGSTSFIAPDRLLRGVTSVEWRIASASRAPVSRARISRASRAPPPVSVSN